MNRWVSDGPCRVAGYVVYDRLNDVTWPADCGSGRCQTCGVERARVRARLITERCRQVDRPRFITLTNASGDWQQRRSQVRDLARRLRSTGFATQWIWVTEAGSLNGMIHVHLIQFGSYIPQADLQDMWGGRRVDIRSARPNHGEYISKSAAAVSGYIGKSAVMDLDAALALNGGRLHHWSRGFFGMPIREYRRTLSDQIPRDCILRFDPEQYRALSA